MTAVAQNKRYSRSKFARLSLLFMYTVDLNAKLHRELQLKLDFTAQKDEALPRLRPRWPVPVMVETLAPSPTATISKYSRTASRVSRPRCELVVNCCVATYFESRSMNLFKDWGRVANFHYISPACDPRVSISASRNFERSHAFSSWLLGQSRYTAESLGHAWMFNYGPQM